MCSIFLILVLFVFIFVEMPMCYPHVSCPTSEKEKSMHHFIYSRNNTYPYQLVLVVNLLWIYEWTSSSPPCLGCPGHFLNSIMVSEPGLLLGLYIGHLILPLVKGPLIGCLFPIGL